MEKTKNFGKITCMMSLCRKRHQKWICTDLPIRGNKKAATAFLNKQLEKYEDVTVPYTKLTFADYLEEWLVSIEAEVRPNTYRNYSANMQNHIIPYFRIQGTLLQELTTLDLENYYRTRLKKGSKLKSGEALSPTTVKHHQQNIRCGATRQTLRFLRLAAKRGARSEMERNRLASKDDQYVRLHDLRHSAATNLLELGFNVVQVAEWLGHESVNTTLKFYGHAIKTSKMEMASALDEVLKKPLIEWVSEDGVRKMLED